MGTGCLDLPLLASKPGMCGSGLAGSWASPAAENQARPISQRPGARACLVLLARGSCVFDLSWASCCTDPNNASQSSANRKPALGAQSTTK